MKIIPIILLAMLMISGCAHLPEIRTVEGGAATSQIAACRSIFPHGKWLFVHAIEIFPPVGSEQTVLGVVRLSSEQRTFHCALMTVEGLVLFEADFDGGVKIRRALPPFDKPGMAAGIVQDISLLFLAPEKPCIAAGISKDSARICRYPYADGGEEEILLKPGGRWEIRQYDQSCHLKLTISPTGLKNPLAGVMSSCVVLKTYGLGGYELRMNLIKAAPLGKGTRSAVKPGISYHPQSQDLVISESLKAVRMHLDASDYPPGLNAKYVAPASFKPATPGND